MRKLTLLVVTGALLGTGGVGQSNSDLSTAKETPALRGQQVAMTAIDWSRSLLAERAVTFRDSAAYRITLPPPI